MGREVLAVSEYKLPKGNVLISFSGGRTSGYMLHKIVEENGGLPDRAKVVFANTGREMPETLDFVQRCSDAWGVKIDWIEYDRVNRKVSVKEVNHNSASRNGEPFENLISFSNYIPNTMRRKCTEELKVRTIKRYLVKAGWEKWSNTVGIRADEARRIRESKDNRWRNWYPLFEANVLKSDVYGFWRANSFDLALSSVNDLTPKSNCDGCFLKSELKLAEMWRDHPDRMEWWAALEEKYGHTFRYDKTSYRDIKNNLDRQGDWVFDVEDFFCQTDDGECTG